MEILLTEGKVKFPNKDFSEQENVIKMLREFEHNYLNISESNRQIKKWAREVFESNSTLKIQLMANAKELQQLKEENINLKNNIKL